MRSPQTAAPAEANDEGIARSQVLLLSHPPSGVLGWTHRQAPAAGTRPDGAHVAPPPGSGRGYRACVGLLGTRPAEGALVPATAAGGGLGAHQPHPQVLPGAVQRSRHADRIFRVGVAT